MFLKKVQTLLNLNLNFEFKFKAAAENLESNSIFFRIPTPILAQLTL
jgi:hypothetical protein